MPAQSDILQQSQQSVTAQKNNEHVRDDVEIWDDENSWDDKKFDREFPDVIDNEDFLDDEDYEDYDHEVNLGDDGNLFESDLEDMKIDMYSLISC